MTDNTITSRDLFGGGSPETVKGISNMKNAVKAEEEAAAASASAFFNC